MSHFIDKEEDWFTEWFQHMVKTMASSPEPEGSAFQELGENGSGTDGAPPIYCTTNLYQNEQFPLLYIQKNPGVFRNQKLLLRVDMVLRSVYEGAYEESRCLMKLRKTMNQVYSCSKTKTQTYFETKNFSYKITDKKVREVLVSYDAVILCNVPGKEGDSPVLQSDAPETNPLEINTQRAQQPFVPLAETHLKLFLQNPDPWGEKRVRSILPPSTARYCKQTLFTVPPSGEYFYTAKTGKKETYTLNNEVNAQPKYHGVIQCQDHSPPAFSKLVPDQEVWLYSAIPMREEIWANQPLKTRYFPVPNSIVFHDEQEQETPLNNTVWNVNDQTITYERDGVITYTPIMHMRVQKLTLSCKESESIGPWSLELREI